MPHPEEEFSQISDPGEPQSPVPLPPELAAFLATEELACLTHNSNRGALYVLKAPASELTSLRGTFPIGLTHELHQHPQAPVIRSVLTFYDQPNQPLRFDTFLNIDDPDQRACFASLAAQDELTMLFYDEHLAHRLSKQQRNTDPAGMRRLLARADRLHAMIPAERFDFDAAKADVLRAMSLYDE
jgi:hypothetical protein